MGMRIDQPGFYLNKTAASVAETCKSSIFWGQDKTS